MYIYCFYSAILHNVNIRLGRGHDICNNSLLQGNTLIAIEETDIDL